MAHGRWYIPVVYRVVVAPCTEAHYRHGDRICAGRRCVPLQAKLPVHGSVMRAASRRLAGEKVLANHNSTRGGLLCLPADYGVLLRSCFTVDFAVGHSIYGRRKLPELWELSRRVCGVLCNVSAEHGCRTTAACQPRMEVRWSIGVGGSAGVVRRGRVISWKSRHGLF